MRLANSLFSDLMNSRVLLTGATGMLGRAITRKFLKEGVSLVALLHPEHPASHKYEQDFPDVKVIYSEMRDSLLHKEEIDGIDAIFHLAWAGTTSTDRLDKELQAKNTDDSIVVLELAKELGVKYFFFAGSQAEYGKNSEGVLETEEMECHPETAYGKEKKRFGDLAEHVLGRAGIRFVHARIFSIYGPHDRPNSLLSLLVSTQKKGEKLTLGPCTHLWNFLHEEDFANLVYASYKNKEFSGTINFVSDDTRPLKEFVKAGFKVDSYEFGSVNPNPEGLVNLNPSFAKLHKCLGEYTFAPFEKAISQMLED